MKKVEKYASVKENYLRKGVAEYNIDYAVDAILEGTKKKLILENLTGDYRKMTEADANAMLNDLYAAGGGEFAVENRRGYFLGGLLLLIGIMCHFIILPFLEQDPGFGFRGMGKYFYLLCYGSLILGALILLSSFLGGYRED